MKNTPAPDQALIRQTGPSTPENQAPCSAQHERNDDDNRPTDCGLTRKELRAIVAEIIG